MNKEVKPFTDEELIEAVSKSLKEVLERTTLNLELYNNPTEIYLHYSYEDNIKIYKAGKEHYAKQGIRFRFLVRPTQPELYEFIKKDIEDNKLKHEVELLPFITHHNLKEIL